MSNDLYFIPIIAKALEQKNTEQSLKHAIEKIKSLGTMPEYKQGYEQFEQFMDIVNKHVKKKASDDLSEIDLIMELIIDLATDTFEGSDEDKQKALSIIKSHPQWQKEYDQLVAEIEELNQRPEGVEISVSRENEPLKSVTFVKIPGSKTIDNITAGGYNISFAIGRLIWKGELAEQDLIWTKAYPGKPLELAADTTERKAKPTKEISVFNGKVIIRVFAGLESGRIEITMNTSEDS